MISAVNSQISQAVIFLEEAGLIMLCFVLRQHCRIGNKDKQSVRFAVFILLLYYRSSLTFRSSGRDLDESENYQAGRHQNDDQILP
jgi:hypothetical protein